MLSSRAPRRQESGRLLADPEKNDARRGPVLASRGRTQGWI